MGIEPEVFYAAIHDIKTPLFTIDVIFQMLEMKQNDMIESGIMTAEFFEDYLYTGKNNCRLIAQIIENMHDVFMIGNDKISFRRASCDLRMLISEVADVFNFYMLSKEISFNTIINGQDFLVDCDGIKMKRILINLLENAIKYTELKRTSPKTIILELFENEDHIIIAVKDNGIGLDSSNELKLSFEDKNRSFSDWGIGLSLVNNICNAMNAELIIGNNEPEGTKVEIILPRK